MSDLNVQAAKRIRPLGTKLFVKRDEADEKTKGGIHLPGTAKDKPKQGRVVEAGEGRELENGKIVKPQAKPGDKVLFSDYAGTELKLNGVPHLIIEDSDILAIIDDGTDIG